MFVERTGFACANGTPTLEDESLNGRMTPISGDLNNLHTNLNAAMTLSLIHISEPTRPY